MDMQMPVMDGVTATREIRKDPQFSKLPIIALTANVMVSEQNEFLDAGITDHIGKPIDPDRLAATLAKWVRPTQNAQSIPAGKTVQNSTPEPLPDLPGINVAETVRRMGGSAALYWSLLDKFRVKQRDFPSDIRQALTVDDRDTAERLAHTLRGIAGTLGAKTLQDLAGLLESSINKVESGEIDLLLARVDKELATFIASIDHVLETRRN
jgi:HPt (histidine-containing phosphotransfer) domain-containing protein